MRPDFERYLRPQPFDRKYSPDQPRDDHGRWTDTGDSADSAGAETTELSAQSRRGPVPVRINGRLMDATPAQAARLAVAEAQARDAVRRVQELDPKWRPTPGLHETVEGQIQNLQAQAAQAQARAGELARVGIGPGPFAGESLTARGPERDFMVIERREINRIGAETGCHTCGTFDPGTRSGNFVPDHEPPNALNPTGRSQRLFPQCSPCSSRQGNWITRNRGLR